MKRNALGIAFASMLVACGASGTYKPSADGDTNGEGGGDPGESAQDGDVGTCTLNCCDGVIENVGEHISHGECEARIDGYQHCLDRGGVAKGLFNDTPIFQDLACEGNCQTNCCNGHVAFTTTDTQSFCELWAGRMCDEHLGPDIVAHDSALVWTSEGICPSLQSCELYCADGASLSTLKYQETVCIYDVLALTFCDAHGGPSAILYDHQEVWSAQP